MKVGIAGMGCVTALGSSPVAVWNAVRSGVCPEAVSISNAESRRNYPARPVRPECVQSLAKESRLRRSSPISLLAVAAGKAAMDGSGVAANPEARRRLAIVFGVSSGGVQYTRRFYEQVVKQGANVASPMLFPETVYNAPASHLAAMLGVDGATYTLVGDGTVGLQALTFGAQLLTMGNADDVLVVASEELDWILLEAHRDWRLTLDGRNRGALLAEGAAAVLLSTRESTGEVEIEAGYSFTTRNEARAAVDSVVGRFAGTGPLDLIVGGGNATWVDDAIDAAIGRHFPGSSALRVDPKAAIGEPLGAGALLQIVLAATGLSELGGQRALVAALGWNQQAAAALVHRRS